MTTPESRTTRSGTTEVEQDGSVEQQRRLFDDARDIREETAGDVAVDHTVVEARAQCGHESAPDP